MLKLLEYKFNNIGRFIEEQTINLVNRDKLIQFDGFNHNTGGSSGSAKTTAIEALDYLLGINSTPTTVLQSRYTKKPMYVEGKFLNDDRPITISRHKKNGLTVVTLEETVSGSSKLAEEKLDTLLGIPRKIIKKMIHKEQGEGGFFLKMTAKEVYNFLITVLGLEGYLINSDQITENIKLFNEQLGTINTNIELFNKSIEEIQQIHDAKIKPVCDITVNQLQTIADQFKQFKEQLQKTQNLKQTKLSKLVGPQKNSIDFDNRMLLQLRKQLGEIHQNKNQCIQEFNEKTQLLSDRINLCKYQIEKIEQTKIDAMQLGQQIQNIKAQRQILVNESKCYTCKQSWTDNGAKQQIIDLDNKTQELIKELLQLKKIIEAENDCNVQLEKFQKERESLDNSWSLNVYDRNIEDFNGRIMREQAKELNLNQEADTVYLRKKSDYLSKINDIETKYAKIIETHQVQVNELNTQLTQQTTIYENHENNFKIYKQELISLNTSLDEKTKNLTKNLDNRVNLTHKISIAEESNRLIKTYLLQIFQETLDTIGESATQTLSNIPNTANCAIYFEGCKETQKGIIKDEINAIVTMDGTNNIPFKSLCGGERAAFDMAVDLAVVDVIELITGKGTDFFILDEPFNGLDSVCREQCLEILKQMGTNKRIIIIDHCNELKEMVNDVINVIRCGENSIIE